MNDYLWLQPHKEQWQQLLQSNKTPHAILISGNRGIGKKNLAHDMAAMALCDNLQGTEICKQCKSCQLLNSGNHTDLKLIQAEDEIIKVNQIRELSRDITLSSARNGYKIALIENAENMNTASANALLKTLEEPPERSILILVTDDISQLLPTIKSRCMKLDIHLPDKKVVHDWLHNSLNPGQDVSELAILLSGGAPLTAAQLLLEDSITGIRMMLEDLLSLQNQVKNILEVSKDWIEQEKVSLLPFISRYFLQVIYYKKGLAAGNISQLFDFKNFDSFLSNEKAYDFVRKIHEFLKRRSKVLKDELMLQELLIDWKAAC